MAQREITVSDFALINGHQYCIRKITADGIYISAKDSQDCSLLINTTQGWQVYQYTLPHKVSFQAKPELREEDLLRMNLYQIEWKLCFSESCRKITQNEDFWYRKVGHDFGEEVRKNKPPEESYADQYRFLFLTSVLERTMKLRKDGLILNEQLGWKLSPVTASCAAEKGDLDLLKWLTTKGVYPTQYGIEQALKNNHREILEWLNLVPPEEEEELSVSEEEVTIPPSGWLSLLNWW